MIDLAGNHVGNIREDYSKINPFNSSEYYYERYQITDRENQEMVENS